MTTGQRSKSIQCQRGWGGSASPLPLPWRVGPDIPQGTRGEEELEALSPQPPLPQPEGLQEALRAQGSGHRGGGGGGGAVQAGSPGRLHPARRRSGPRDWAPCRRPGSCSAQSSPPACPPWAPPRGRDTPRSPGWGRRKGRDIFPRLGQVLETPIITHPWGPRIPDSTGASPVCPVDSRGGVGVGS